MNSKYFKIIFTVFIIIFITARCLAQSDSSYTETENILEQILNNTSSESDNSSLYQIFEEYINNPVDLNKADISELEQIPTVNHQYAKIIIEHRKKYGYYFSKNELYSISEIPTIKTKQIIPFVKVSKTQSKLKNEKGQYNQNFFSNIDVNYRARVIKNLQSRKGFINNKFSGSAYKLYNRVLFHYHDNFEFGLTTEKDAGEKQFNDFQSGHIYGEDLGIMRQFLVGDYLLQFGQGLTFWSPYGFSKGADATYTLKKKERFIKPYTSSTENNYFRGVATSLAIDHFRLSLFYSRNYLDAHIDSVSGLILSTPLTGYHRTTNEIAYKNSVSEIMYGTNLEFNANDNFKVGFTFYNSRFNHQFFPKSNYALSGSKFNYYSGYYDAYIDKFNFSGEFSYNGISVASINNLVLKLNKRFTYALSIRSYPRNFTNLHGFGFGERSGSTQNEFGIYNGIKFRLPVGKINFYYDQFRFPYASYNLPLPGRGYEFMLNFTTHPFRRIETQLRAKYEKKQVGVTTSISKLISNRIKQNYRFDLLYEVSKNLRLRERFEYNHYFLAQNSSNENGILFFQEMRVHISKLLSVYGRIMFYKTDSFNSAVYEYENDLVGIFKNVALFGQGIRWYFLIRYRLFNMVNISLKYAETEKPGVKELGSGYSTIYGNMDNSLNLQLDFKY